MPTLVHSSCWYCTFDQTCLPEAIRVCVVSTKIWWICRYIYICIYYIYIYICMHMSLYVYVYVWISGLPQSIFQRKEKMWFSVSCQWFGDVLRFTQLKPTFEYFELVFWISSCSQMEHNTYEKRVVWDDFPVGFPRSWRVLGSASVSPGSSGAASASITSSAWWDVPKAKDHERPALVYISRGSITNNIEMFVRSFEWWMVKCCIYRGCIICIDCGGEKSKRSFERCWLRTVGIPCNSLISCCPFECLQTVYKPLVTSQPFAEVHLSLTSTQSSQKRRRCPRWYIRVVGILHLIKRACLKLYEFA